MNLPGGNIFLVGPMGAGKTTIGRLLARELDKEFLDSDHELEARTGAQVTLIFEVEGEKGFRHREKAMVDELTQRQDIVLATGGGVVLDRDNRSHLIQRGLVIYLDAPLDQLVERTRRDRNRPLLQGADSAARLAAIMRERGPLYCQVADMVVKTNHRTVRSVVREILKRIDIK